MNQIVEGNINYSIKDSKSFDYKITITGRLDHNNTEKDVELVVPLKHLNNFWRILDIPLDILDIIRLTWPESCVITRNTTRDADPDADPAVALVNNPTNATFKIADTKSYAPVATLSTEDDSKLLEQLKTRFKRTITWNKNRSEMSNQAKINNLSYLIDPTFNFVNRLFVLLFEKEDDRKSFSRYYTLSVDKKDFDVLIDDKTFFDAPIKSKEET